MDTVHESEAPPSNINNNSEGNIGEEPIQAEPLNSHGAKSDSFQTPKEDNQAAECSGGSGTIQEGEATDKGEEIDTQTCRVQSFDSCKAVVELENPNRMDEVDVDGKVENAGGSESRDCHADIVVEVAGQDNEIRDSGKELSSERVELGAGTHHVDVSVDIAGRENKTDSCGEEDIGGTRAELESESTGSIVNAVYKIAGLVSKSGDNHVGGERAGVENESESRNRDVDTVANRAQLESESRDSDVDTVANRAQLESENRHRDLEASSDRAKAENAIEEETVDNPSANNGEENRENRSEGAALPDESRNDDNEKTAGDADKTNNTIDECKARNWSKKEVQDLLIKAINFRAPMRDVQTILRCGVEVNAAVKNGLNPLHYAAYCDNDASVEILLNAGANVNATDDIGYTPLHLCARRGNHRTMKVLIENGSMINFNEIGKEIRQTEETNKLGYTTTEPLNLAIQNLHPKCVKLLLDSGARSNNKYFMGTEICLAPLDDVECMELLLQYGADPNVFNRCGLSPLMKACKDHHISAVRTLIKYKADINALCPPLFEQKSVLQFAIMSGNIVIINILLQRGAIITRQGEYNFSALHTAVMKGRADICRILLQYGADANERTAEGATALMLACCTPELKERREIVALLIDCGADVNAYSPTYSFFDPYLSPLTEYMKNIENTEEFSIVDMLVRHGAEVHFSSSGLDRELRRLRDPFSILPYSHCLENYPDTFDMLINLSNKYCPLLIHANEKLSEEKKDALLYIGTRPRELKHQVRIMLRQQLTPGLPENVEKLPLPSILKKYVMVK